MKISAGTGRQPQYAMVFAGEHMADAFPRWWAGRWSTDVGRGRLRPVLAGLLIAGALCLVALSVPFVRCIRVARADYPARAVSLLERWGDGAIVIARFVPGLRSAIFFVAGALGRSPRRVLLVDLLAAVVHVPLLLSVGAHLG